MEAVRKSSLIPRATRNLANKLAVQNRSSLFCPLALSMKPPGDEVAGHIKPPSLI